MSGQVKIKKPGTTGSGRRNELVTREKIRIIRLQMITLNTLKTQSSLRFKEKKNYSYT